MSRVLWKGAITFGLVHIPVRLHAATRDTSVHFHLLSEDGTCRLRRKLFCPDTGEEVEYARTTRGLEVAPGQYVVVTDEEIAALRPEKTRAIEIEDFVALGDIDPVYYDRPYWVSPGEGGARPYRLLVETLKASGRVGIGRFVMREKEYLAAVRVIGGVLTVSTMHWHDEVVPKEEALEASVPSGKVDERQKELALRLVEQLTRRFEPRRYVNTFQAALKELIERKAAGERIEVREPEPEKEAEIVDLAAALEASLRGAGTARPASRAKRPKSPARATPKTPPARRKRPAKT